MADAPGWVQALVLGVVQGLAEFIPVSSSGHLVLVPALAGWERHGLAFDVALHVGTLAALVVYYRRDLWGIVRALFGRPTVAESAVHRRLAVLLLTASVPVAVAGLVLGEVVEAVFASPVAAAWLLFVTAGVLVGGERLHRRRTDGSRTVTATSAATDDAGGAGRIGWRQALLVGVAQMFALLPGLSRSGLTISAGIAAGLPRPLATRFAFLLGLPAIAGAALVQIPQLGGGVQVSPVELTVGVVAAAGSGYLAIALLVRLVSRVGIDRFAWYLVPVAALALWVLR